MTLTYVISGFAVGLLVGMTGVGGGSLMTPLLTLMFGVSPSVAVGTDLAFASITKGAGTFTHRLRGTVRWDIVGRLCAGALPSALVATYFLHQFGALDKEIGLIIRYSIAGSVLLTVIALLFKARMLAWINAHPERQLQGRALVIATVLCGAVLGTLVTVSSIGA
ncbi:MAG: sulfite exporter TauE/SafE family protein, partial [Pseudomonadota bacterium]